MIRLNILRQIAVETVLKRHPFGIPCFYTGSPGGLLRPPESAFFFKHSNISPSYSPITLRTEFASFISFVP